jgi:hypothetical protein
LLGEKAAYKLEPSESNHETVVIEVSFDKLEKLTYNKNLPDNKVTKGRLSLSAG